MPFSLFNSNGTMNAVYAQNIMRAASNLDRNTQFRLFPSVGESASTVLSLSNTAWRILNVEGDRVTLWAASAYRNAAFNTSSEVANGVNANVYFHPNRSSNVRNTIVADFAELNGLIPGLANHVPIHGTTAVNANYHDHMWLPSELEVQNGGTWSLNDAQRSYATRGFHTWAWLRTPGAGDTTNARGVTSSGASVTAL